MSSSHDFFNEVNQRLEYFLEVSLRLEDIFLCSSDISKDKRIGSNTPLKNLMQEGR
jgi:hypothetical protein